MKCHRLGEFVIGCGHGTLDGSLDGVSEEFVVGVFGKDAILLYLVLVVRRALREREEVGYGSSR